MLDASRASHFVGEHGRAQCVRLFAFPTEGPILFALGFPMGPAERRASRNAWGLSAPPPLPPESPNVSNTKERAPLPP